MNKEIAVKWFKQASHDLLMAEKNLEIEGYDVADLVPYEAYDKEIATEKVEKAKQIFELLKEKYKDLKEYANE